MNGGWKEHWELKSVRCPLGCQLAGGTGSFPWGTRTRVALTVFTPVVSIHIISHPVILQEERETSLEVTWAGGKGNASQGHRRKLWFSLPLPAAFAPSVPASSHALVLSFIPTTLPPP